MLICISIVDSCAKNLDYRAWHRSFYQGNALYMPDSSVIVL